MKEILYFLQQLCVNNNREWFNYNRTLYKRQKEEFETIVTRLIANVSEFDSSVSQLTVKDCTYRINRDTRFSNDKTPYKTHFGAFIAPGGKKACTSGYYLHIEPDNSIIAGGVHMPPSDVLLKLRTAIFENATEFISIIENPEFKKIFSTLDGDKLTAAPRGFSKNFEHIDLLKFKSYTFACKVSDDFIENSDVEAFVVNRFKIMKDFNSFMNRALLG